MGPSWPGRAPRVIAEESLIIIFAFISLKIVLFLMLNCVSIKGY